MLNGKALSLGISYKSIQFSDISSTCPNNDALTECTRACVYSVPAMSSGEYYCPTFCWCLSRGGTSMINGTMIASVYCNGSVKCTCTVISCVTENCSGSWNFQVNYNDNICIVTCAVRHASDDTLSPIRSSICLSSVSSTSGGNYCVGSPSYQLSQTCVPSM